MTAKQDEIRQKAFRQTLMSARQTMVFSEVLKLAFDAFAASKLRSALTALGMVIGSASVILVVTIGLTGKQWIISEIQKFGTNEVEVEYSGGGTAASEHVANSDLLTRDDEKAVLAQLPGVMYSSPVLETHDRISIGSGVTKETLVLGVSPQYQFIHSLTVPIGRFLDDTDESAHIKAAVVTGAFAKEMYGSSESAIGRSFQISGIPFTIIGIFKNVEDFGASEIADQTILIPYSVARYLTGTDSVKQIYFSMSSMEQVPDATKEVVRIISARHRPNSVYKAQNLRELLDTAATIANILTVVLLLVSSVTLAVGGVGIMNIMLANVRARIREIGIRKALGATAREIKLQFLTEAVIISLSGGIVGTIIGLLIPFSVRLFTPYVLPVDWRSAAIALITSVLIGIIFGTVPATRAAQLDPVESLKYE